jgi:hypothetical protein
VERREAQGYHQREGGGRKTKERKREQMKEKRMKTVADGTLG